MKSTDLQHLCTAIVVAVMAAKPGSITAAECRGGGSSFGVGIRSPRYPYKVLVNG